MLTRKLSHTTQKGDSLLKNKLKLKNQQPKYEKVQNNFVSVNYQQNRKIEIKNPSIITKSTMNRTFIRRTTMNSLVGQNLSNTNTTNNSSLYNKSRILKNSVSKNVVNSRSGEGQKQVNVQEKMIKTPVRNISNNQNSLNQKKYTKSRTPNIFNPEQKKIPTTRATAHKDVQMLNTRKSKFETDSNLRNLKKDQSKQNGDRSKQIKIHPVKNLGSRMSQKQQQRKECIILRQKEMRVQSGNSNKRSQSKQQVSIKHQSSQLNQRVQIQKVGHIASNQPLDQPQQDSIISCQTVSAYEQPQSSIHQDSSPHSLFSQRGNHQLIQQIQNPSLSSNSHQNQNHSLSPQRQTSPSSRSAQQQSNIDLSSLISNTQDIIDFINRLNLRNRMQAFDLMVTQLSQLNLIAQQVHQLGQIGNTLGYSLVNVFGARIRQLQTTIINQVGIALITTFEERIDPEFQSLVQSFRENDRVREPALRTGFCKGDIEKTFDEKFTFEEVQCSICLENVKSGQKVIPLQCHHKFHPICIKTWLQNSKKCPLCRAEQRRKND